MKKTFVADIVCESCNGTGLYSGMAENNGCAVICHTCNGTGKFHQVFEYEEFKERKIIKGIKRVFKTSCGYRHTADDFTDDKGKTIEFSKGGCTYKEFLAGVEPKPVKDLYCPKLWTGQEYDSERCNEHGYIGYIPTCKNWNTKCKCWEEFEKKGKKK